MRFKKICNKSEDDIMMMSRFRTHLQMVVKLYATFGPKEGAKVVNRKTLCYVNSNNWNKWGEKILVIIKVICWKSHLEMGKT